MSHAIPPIAACATTRRSYCARSELLKLDVRYRDGWVAVSASCVADEVGDELEVLDGRRLEEIGAADVVL